MQSLYLSKKQVTILILLAAVVTFVGYQAFLKMKQERRAASDVGQAFGEDSEVRLVDQNGNSVNFDIANEQVTLVAFWASWDPNSAKLLLTLDELASSGEWSEVRFLAVNRNEPPSRIEAYFAQNQRPNTIDIVTDISDQLFAQVESYAMPETVLFNSEGELVWRKRGVLEQRELQQALELVE